MVLWRAELKSANKAWKKGTLPEKLAKVTGFYCDTHNFVAISTFSATTVDFGCVRVTFCCQNLSVAIKILLVAISRRYHNARFGSLQQGGGIPNEKQCVACRVRLMQCILDWLLFLMLSQPK